MANESSDKPVPEAGGGGELVPVNPGPGEVALADAKTAAVAVPEVTAGPPAPAEELHWMRPEPPLLSGRGVQRLWRRQRVIMLATAGVVTVLAAIYAFTATPIYRAEAKLIIEPDKSAAANLQGVVPGAQPDLTAIDTQAAVIASSELAAAAVERLRLGEDPRFNPALGKTGGLLGAAASVLAWLQGGGAGADSPELIHEAVVNNYLAGLHAVPNARSRVISVLYDSPSPELSARAANTAAVLYVEQPLAAAKAAAEAKSATPAGPSLQELQQRLATAEQKLADFQRSAANGPVGGTALLAQQLARVEDQLSQVRLDLAEAKTRSDQAQQILNAPDRAAAADTLIDTPAIQDMRQQASRLEAQLADLRTQYRDSHPKVQEALAQQSDLRNKIRAELARVVQGFRSQYDLAKVREQKLMQEESSLQGQMRQQRDADAQKAVLQSDVQTSRELYQAMLARLSGAKADGETLPAPSAHVISEASVPTVPAYPKKAEIIAIAFGLSLVLGVILALIAEYFESGFRMRSQLEARTGLAVLGVVPIVPKTGKHSGPPHRWALAEPNSTYGEAIRALRSALLQPRGGYRPRVIMVTSSIPGEGKTSTALSIATTAARVKLRTVIVECDVLRPSLYKALDCTIGPGLGDYLSGRATIEEIVRVDQPSGAHFITAGDPMPNASDLLDSDRLKLLVSGMREVYDLVVIDSPPVLAVSDTVVVQRLVDETVFLVRWKKTPRDIVYAALRQLAESGGTISGLGLTQVDMRKHAVYEFGKHADKYYTAYRNYHSDAA